ncbi:MAG TPA: hypothetical protein VKU60_12050 [Chloroflexota bacterium]|nr:hypothetical protein [Chloroflexota bacterium]
MSDDGTPKTTWRPCPEGTAEAAAEEGTPAEEAGAAADELGFAVGATEGARAAADPQPKDASSNTVTASQGTWLPSLAGEVFDLAFTMKSSSVSCDSPAACYQHFEIPQVYNRSHYG